MSLRTLANAIVAVVQAIARHTMAPVRVDIPVPVRVERRPPPSRRA